MLYLFCLIPLAIFAYILCVEGKDMCERWLNEKQKSKADLLAAVKMRY